MLIARRDDARELLERALELALELGFTRRSFRPSRLYRLLQRLNLAPQVTNLGALGVRARLRRRRRVLQPRVDHRERLDLRRQVTPLLLQLTGVLAEPVRLRLRLERACVRPLHGLFRARRGRRRVLPRRRELALRDGELRGHVLQLRLRDADLVAGFSLRRLDGQLHLASQHVQVLAVEGVAVVQRAVQRVAPLAFLRELRPELHAAGRSLLGEGAGSRRFRVRRSHRLLRGGPRAFRACVRVRASRPRPGGVVELGLPRLLELVALLA